MKSTEEIRILSGTLTLEGLWSPGPGNRGAVVAHPHPLYGGNMHNNVVRAAAEGLLDADVGALAFNFRGVGGSSGNYDRGKGEEEDLAAAYQHLATVGCTDRMIAGYSFGAWIAAKTAAELKPSAVILISPPLSIWDFHEVEESRTPVYIVATNRDDVCPLSQLEPFLESLTNLAASEILQGDHFYIGRETEIRKTVRGWFEHTSGHNQRDPRSLSGL